MKKRNDGRQHDEMRPVKLLPPFQKHSFGSVIIEVGNTIVNCSVNMEKKVPRFLDPEKQGWLTCEYSMLPGSSSQRITREASRGKLSGRTMEIQRLIGRSIRSVIDLTKIPGKTLWVDCDVLQADGGTRTAAITGASVALHLAVKKMLQEGLIEESPIQEHLAAISVGIVSGEPLLDINYLEDSTADVDLNLVMTSSGRFVELQGSSEGNTFTETELEQMIALGKSGIQKLVEIQSSHLE